MGKKVILFMLLSVISAVGFAASSGPVGAVIITKGNVFVLSGTSKRQLQRKSEIYLNELITTDIGGYAQLRLNDGTILSLNPDTKYAVDEFNLDKNNPKNNRYVGRLIQGALVSLSSQGKDTTHSNHIVKTPIVTISIRGTLFATGFLAKKLDLKSSDASSGDVSAVPGGTINKLVDTAKGGSDLVAPDSSFLAKTAQAVSAGLTSNSSSTQGICTESVQKIAAMSGGRTPTAFAAGYVSVYDGMVRVVGKGYSFDVSGDDKNNTFVYMALGDMLLNTGFVPFAASQFAAVVPESVLRTMIGTFGGGFSAMSGISMENSAINAMINYVYGKGDINSAFSGLQSQVSSIIGTQFYTGVLNMLGPDITNRISQAAQALLLFHL